MSAPQTFGTSKSTATSVKIKGQCLDAGQGGANPTGQGQGIFTCNGGGWQQLWLENGMIKNNAGTCLDANGDTGNWYWSDNCNSGNTNQTGFKVVDSQGQKILQHLDKNCLDVGNSNLWWPCDPTNVNQQLTFA